MGKSAVNRLRLFSIARFDHQRVSRMYQVFALKAPGLPKMIAVVTQTTSGPFRHEMFVSQIPSLWKLESHFGEVKTTCLFVVAGKNPCSFFTLFHDVSCLLDFHGFPGSQLRTCAPAGLGDLDTFSGHDQLCGTGGIGAPTESVETQWILASKWGFTNKIWVIFPRNMRTYEFHQQNMVKLPSKIGANWWWAVSCLNSLRWACRNHYRHNQLDKKDSGVINCLRLATKWGIQARKSSGFRVPTDMIWDKTMAMDYCQSTNNNHLYKYWT